jgi:beta-glucanase (GH16 family)
MLGLSLCGYLATSGRLGEGAPQLEKPGWRLTFHDEFDGSQLDPDKWQDHFPAWHSSTRDGRTHGKRELQYYARDGYEIAGGRIWLRAQRRARGGKPFTSGMICTAGRFAQKYGWFEIRARFPKGQGLWSAFWLLPDRDAWPPEVDVLEVLGHQPQRLYFATHWGHKGGGEQLQEVAFCEGPDYSSSFHTIALEWDTARLRWYVDGVRRHTATRGVPHEPMYLVANLAVGGEGSWPGPPDATTALPAVMEVDYIRVYRRE